MTEWSHKDFLMPNTANRIIPHISQKNSLEN